MAKYVRCIGDPQKYLTAGLAVIHPSIHEQPCRSVHHVANFGQAYSERPFQAVQQKFLLVDLVSNLYILNQLFSSRFACFYCHHMAFGNGEMHYLGEKPALAVVVAFLLRQSVSGPVSLRSPSLLPTIPSGLSLQRHCGVFLKGGIWHHGSFQVGFPCTIFLWNTNSRFFEQCLSIEWFWLPKKEVKARPCLIIPQDSTPETPCRYSCFIQRCHFVCIGQYTGVTLKQIMVMQLLSMIILQ